jgi:hypothetical protein
MVSIMVELLPVEAADETYLFFILLDTLVCFTQLGECINDETCNDLCDEDDH